MPVGRPRDTRLALPDILERIGGPEICQLDLAGRRDWGQEDCGFGFAQPHERDALSIRGPGGSDVILLRIGQAQPSILAESRRIDIDVVVVLASPRICDLLAIRREGRVPRVAQGSRDRDDFGRKRDLHRAQQSPYPCSHEQPRNDSDGNQPGTLARAIGLRWYIALPLQLLELDASITGALQSCAYIFLKTAMQQAHQRRRRRRRKHRPIGL